MMCANASFLLKYFLYFALSGFAISLWSMEKVLVTVLSPKRLSITIESYDKSRDFEAIRRIAAEGSEGGIGAANCFLSQDTKVARVDDMTVGFIVYAIEEAGNGYSPRGYIEYLGVSESMRRRGVGSFLLASAMQEVESHGLGRIDLKVFRNNELAIRLYRSRGFVEKSSCKKKLMTMVYRTQRELVPMRRCISIKAAWSWMVSWASNLLKSHDE